MTSNLVMLLFLMTIRLSWKIHDGGTQYLSLDCAVQHFQDAGWSRSDTFGVL